MPVIKKNIRILTNKKKNIKFYNYFTYIAEFMVKLKQCVLNLFLIIGGSLESGVKNTRNA